VKWRQETSTADLVVEVGIPVATMALVGSLTFFLLELRGLFYPEGIATLRFVFFCYIVGVVLINRLSAMFTGQGSAFPYSLAMAITMFLFVLVFTSMYGYIAGTANDMTGGMPLLTNLLIVAVVWVVADRVTKSCSIETDASADAGVGMVDSALRPWVVKEKVEEQEKQDEVQKDVSPFRKKHPGRAVFYFAFLAIPMFAVGQNMIPKASPDAISALFRHTVVYIASSLLLLMFTSYASLRRYFNLRETNVPGHVGGFWIIAGALIVFAAIALARGMPMPVPFVGTPESVQVAGDGYRFASRGPKVGLQDPASPDSGGRAREERLKPGDKAAGQKTAADSSRSQVNRRVDRGSGREPFFQRMIASIRQWFLGYPRLTQALIAVSCVVLGVIIVPLILAGIAGLFGGGRRVLKSLFGWAPRVLRRVLEALGILRAPRFAFKMPRLALSRRKRARLGRLATAARYPDPFMNKTADTMSLSKLIDYSYRALVARGRDMGISPSLDQTEYEFLRFYGERRPETFSIARTLTEMYLFNEFSESDPPDQWRPWLQEFWQRIA